MTTSSGNGAPLGSGAALPSSPVRISVLGSNQSTTADGRGRFTLTGVRAGDVTLRFQAAGVDARLSLGGLLDGQVISINVHASGSVARLDSSGGRDGDRDDHEFTGTVEAVTPPTLVVSGTTVRTSDATEIKRGNLEIAVGDIQAGETAKVEGELQADGSVVAREIKLTGAIESIAPPSFVVAGRSVLTDGNTEFKGKGRTHSLADLNVGDIVEVEALESAAGTVLALEIQRLEEAGDDDDDDDDGDDDDEDEDDDDDEDDDEDDDDNSGHGS